LATLETKRADLLLQSKNLAKAVAAGADVAFIRDEICDVDKRTAEVNRLLKSTQEDLKARETAQLLLRPLDSPDKVYEKRHEEEMRSKLRLEIRQRVSRIDLFRDGTVDAKEQPDLPEPWDLQCQIQPGFKVTLVNGAQVWVLSVSAKTTVIELPPAGQAVSFWQTTKKELKGWEFVRCVTNAGVNELCQPKAV
jgi:hypothetical protein